MKYYAILDTNVIVSAALKPESVPGQILELAFDGVIVPVLNKTILSEYQNVLMRPKFGFQKDIVSDIVSDLDERGVHIDSPERLNLELPDPKDVVFYEVVMEERRVEDAYLVTGNIKHNFHVI